jgi:hypothetical protein
MSSFSPEPIEIKLGQMTYKVRPLKWKRLIPMKNALVDLIKELDSALDLRALIGSLGSKEGNPQLEFDKISAALETVIDKVSPVLCLAIPELKPSLFEPDAPDEDSPDIGQVLDAFDAIFKANRIELLKNLLSGTANQPTQ